MNGRKRELSELQFAVKLYVANSKKTRANTIIIFSMTDDLFFSMSNYLKYIFKKIVNASSNFVLYFDFTLTISS